MRKQNGISMVALLITIIVILILTKVTIDSVAQTPGVAKLTRFSSDMEELQQAVILSYDEICAASINEVSLKADEEIYSEIATGNGVVTLFNGTLPTEVSDLGATRAWKINDTSKLKEMSTLPDYGDGNYYISDNGIVFLGNGYTINNITYYKSEN